MDLFSPLFLSFLGEGTAENKRTKSEQSPLFNERMMELINEGIVSFLIADAVPGYFSSSH